MATRSGRVQPRLFMSAGGFTIGRTDAWFALCAAFRALPLS